MTRLLSTSLAILLALGAARAAETPDGEPRDRLDFIDSSLRIASGYHGPARSAYARRELDRMAEELASRIPGVDDPAETIRILNHYVFVEQKFSYTATPGQLPAQSLFLDEVMHYRRGQCVGLAFVYLALADRLELPIRGVMVPNHFLLRWESDGFRRNIDPGLRGRSRPDRYYVRTRGILPQQRGSLYLKSLSPVQSLGYLLHLRGVLHTLDGNYDRARADHDAAGLVFDEGGSGNPMSYNFMGDVFLARAESKDVEPEALQRDGDTALDLYQKAIEADRFFEPSYLNRAFVFRLQGNIESAIYECNRALEINPNYLRALFWRGAFHFMDDDFAAARRDFRKVVNHGPETPFYGLAREYMKRIRDLAD